MFTFILCPIDFSEHSIRSLDYAIALAARRHGRVMLLHVAHPLLVEAAAAAYGLTFVKDEAERDLRNLAATATAKARAAGPPIEVQVRVGDPAEEIVKCADDIHADSVVMGTHGLSGYRKMFFGSVTELVLRHSHMPVLAVPPGDDEQIGIGAEGPVLRLVRVMAPVDFSDRSLADARVALELANAFSVPLLIVHVVTAIRAAATWRDTLASHERILLARARTKMDRLASALSGGSNVETLVEIGSPSDEIAVIAAERHVGLIVMGLVSAGGLLGARPGRIAYHVLCLATAPVLALPPTAISRAAASE